MVAASATLTPAPGTSARARRVADETAYLLLGLLSGTAAFTVWVTGVSLSLSLGVLLIGFPVILATFLAFELLANLERRRAALILGAPIAAAYRPARGRLVERLKTIVHDRQRWKDVLYLLLLGPVGVGKATVALVLWGVAVGTTLAPLWWWSLPAGIEYGIFTIDSWALSFAAVPVGVALWPLTVVIQRGMARSQAAMARSLLGPSLSARVEHLTETRAGAVDAAAAELHRIERDLHDGAQARLVALALDLGMAEERFDRDPDGARELVGEAREEARRALAELRDLARGIRPSLLAERGLGPAISALAARSPVPARARVDVPGRPPEAIEAAAWFVVSEALANAGKHSGAREVTIELTGDGEALMVEVTDDGRGGADPAGNGLRGLEQRVAALDGTLKITSPPGGPTVVRAFLPCVS